MAGVLCKPTFTEVVEKKLNAVTVVIAEFYQRRQQQCSRPAAFKNATVRERPNAVSQEFGKRTSTCTVPLCLGA